MTIKRYFFRRFLGFLGFLLILFSVSFFVASFANAVDLTSTNFIVRDPIVGTLGDFGSSSNFQLISAGHTTLSDIGGTSTNFQIRYGFLYYNDNEITFDIDTASGGGNGESNTPYAVALGTITTTDTRVSGTTDGIQMVVLEGSVGGASGMTVTVRNANGTSGLVSTGTPTSNINSADGAIVDGTENYGLCVATSGLIGFTIATPYASNTCATNSETNDVEALSSVGEDILNTAGAAMTTGHAEVIVNGAISNVTPSHTDYTDTITFIATATF